VYLKQLASLHRQVCNAFDVWVCMDRPSCRMLLATAASYDLFPVPQNEAELRATCDMPPASTTAACLLRWAPHQNIGNTPKVVWFVKNPCYSVNSNFEFLILEHHLKLAIPFFSQIFEGSDCSRFRFLKQYTPENKHDNGKTRNMIRIEDGSPIKHGDFHCHFSFRERISSVLMWYVIWPGSFL